MADPVDISAAAVELYIKRHCCESCTNSLLRALVAELDRVDVNYRICDAELAARAWQPIATAPRDGTRVLVFCPYEESGTTCDAAFLNGEWWRVDFSVPDDPTHWQPLPAPPEAE